MEPIREVIQIFFDPRRESDDEVWYYSTEAQLEELLQSLDKEKWEEELVKNIEDMREEILKQMTVTEQLTAEAKGSKKSMLEIENGTYRNAWMP